MPKSNTSLNELLHEIRRIEQSRVVLSEKKIEKLYKSLIKDLNGYLGNTYAQYADKDGRLYKNDLAQKIKYAKFLEEITDNVDTLSIAQKKEIMNIVEQTYTQCYKGMVKAIKETDVKDISKVIDNLNVQPTVIKQAFNNSISKLTLPKILEKNRNEVIYDIQQTLNTGLINGDRYETMARRITERVNFSYGKAMNTVRTETHRNIESGFMDSAKDISNGLNESDLIYSAIWRTMKDERVRPQVRVHTSKGWRTKKSTNSANHQKMEGKTVKVGELFQLEPNVYAECPGQSGTARNDCRCRCFLEYNLMTVEEFAEATGQTVEQVREKHNIKTQSTSNTENKDNELPVTQSEEKVIIKLSDYPVEFTKGAEGKNTQKLIDYINNIEGADPNVLKLYASTGKLENLASNGITFKISHSKNHSVNTRGYYNRLVEVKYTVPKFKGNNIAGQVNTTLHEQMHLLDLFGREDEKIISKWFSSSNKKLVETFENTTDEISAEITELFKKHNAEYRTVRKNVTAEYTKKIADTKEKIMQGKSPWEDYSAYKLYEKEAKKLQKEMIEEIDYQARNIMGSGVGNLQDIYDALSGGAYRANGVVIYGHGQKYYSILDSRIEETVANYASLSVTRPDLIKMLRKDKPDLCNALDETIQALIEKAGV